MMGYILLDPLETENNINEDGVNAYNLHPSTLETTVFNSVGYFALWGLVWLRAVLTELLSISEKMGLTV